MTDKPQEKPGPGLADVDPQPISHVAGEGVDPDGDVDAHKTVKEQREKLPERGKNLP